MTCGAHCNESCPPPRSERETQTWSVLQSGVGTLTWLKTARERRGTLGFAGCAYRVLQARNVPDAGAGALPSPSEDGSEDGRVFIGEVASSASVPVPFEGDVVLVPRCAASRSHGTFSVTLDVHVERSSYDDPAHGFCRGHRYYLQDIEPSGVVTHVEHLRNPE